MIVAHRLSTVRYCDLIYVLKNGRVEEKGSHEDLMALEHGTYRSMWQLQQVGAPREGRPVWLRLLIGWLCTGRGEAASDGDAPRNGWRPCRHVASRGTGQGLGQPRLAKTPDTIVARARVCKSTKMSSLAPFLGSQMYPQGRLSSSGGSEAAGRWRLHRRPTGP